MLLEYCKVLIDGKDAADIVEGEELTLMHWGNCIITKIGKAQDGNLDLKATLHLEGDFKKTKKKLQWVPDLPEK